MEYETDPGSRAGPGASETIFSRHNVFQSISIFVAQFSFSVQKFHIYIGPNGCTTRSDQDNKVETCLLNNPFHHYPDHPIYEQNND